MLVASVGDGGHGPADGFITATLIYEPSGQGEQLLWQWVLRP